MPATTAPTPALAPSGRVRPVQHPASAFDAFSPRRRAFIVLIFGGLWTLGSFATDLFLPAMPTAAEALGATESAVALTVTAFLLGLGLGQLIAGPLSDERGRRPTLLAGLVVFTATALVCIVAPTVELLIVARLVQGMAAAFGLAIPNAMVTDYARDSRAARLYSWIVIIGGTAPLVASLAGAQTLRLLGWRGPFIALAAISVVALAATALWLPESLPRERRVSGGVRAALRTMARLTRDRLFVGYTLTGALVYMAFFSYLGGSSFVLQQVYGISPTTYSLLFAVNGLGMLAAGQVNHRLLARFSPRTLLTVVLVTFAAAATAALMCALTGAFGIWGLAVPFFVVVAGMGVILPDLTALALSLHPDVAGTASAYFGGLRLGVGALAMPLIGIGGAVTETAVTLLMAVAAVAALALFLATARRARGRQVLLGLPEEVSSDVPVA
jgi:MFS transporter, DHA1 family, multidrug resistance protein